MKKIDVFIRLGKRPHAGYFDLINYPPENINYVYPKIIKSKNEKVGLLHKIKVFLWLKYIKNNPSIIKIYSDCDVIHSTNNIMNSSKHPWVMDVENLLGLMGFSPENHKNQRYFKKVKKVLSSKYCKKLMPYTNASKLSMVNGGLKDIENKMEVLYLAKKSVPLFKKKSNKIPVILWVGRRYWEKGGDTVLKVYDKLNKKADFKLIMRGPVPDEIKDKYKGRENLEFSDTRDYISDNIWEDLYKNADIFLYPTNLDSFGLAFLDAMNYQVPIVTSDSFSAPEIVEDGKNGFVVKHPLKWHDENFQMTYSSFDSYIERLKTFYDEEYISELSKKVMMLLKDKKLREKMGKIGHEMISQGKFSIEERNKKLGKIYADAMN